MSTAKIPAKPSKEVIYIDVDDEITSIIDKVEGAKQKVVALVLPKRATTLQSTVNMKLLQKSSKAAGKNVVLITSETALLPLAGAAGLHVAKNLNSRPAIPDSPEAASEIPVTDAEPAELDEATEEPQDESDLPAKIDYSSSIGALAAAHEVDNPETIELGDDEDDAAPEPAKKKKPSKDKKLAVPNFDRFRLVLLAGIVGLIALIIFIYMAMFTLPKATITITGSSVPVSTNFNLTTSDSATSLDESKGVIPAKLATSDQTSSQQVQATGQKNNGVKATGSVIMTACVSSPSQLSDIPAGTGISTNGLTYITQQTASFSFSGSCNGGSDFKFVSGSINISAQQPGAKFNTSLSGAAVAGYSKVTASGSTSGGTDDIQTILSQQDVDGAKAKITTEDTNNFIATFQDQLKNQGWYVLKSTLKAGDPQITATPAVGQPASTANVTVKITYTVLTVKQDDLTKVIKDKLNDQFDASKQKVNDNFLAGTEITVQNLSAPTKATLAVNVDTTAVPILDVASVKKQAAGHKTGDVRNSVSALPGVKSVDVKLSPFWVSKVPKNQSKIKVVIQEVKSSAP
jgi:hypothetical protein